MSLAINEIIVGAVITEAIALLIMFFRSFPVIQEKMKDLQETATKVQNQIDAQRTKIDTHTVQLAEAKKDHENIKREFDENKQAVKEIYTELRRAMEENTKAIVLLDTTLQLIRERL